MDWRVAGLAGLADRTNRVPPIFFDWHVSHLPLAGASYSASPKPFQKMTSLTIEPKLPEGRIIWFIWGFYIYIYLFVLPRTVACKSHQSIQAGVQEVHLCDCDRKWPWKQWT